MISIITMCKDRGGERLINCLKSLENEFIKEIIIVDYGSSIPLRLGIDTPKDMKNIKIVRYDKNIVMNKSHALNYGIKKSTQPFIMTIDCDMVISQEVINKISRLYSQDVFLVDTYVKRIEMADLGKWERSWDWYEDNQNFTRINSKANGGIQIFSRKWIEKVHGYDEDLILWGAVDNCLYNRAVLDGLTLVDLNIPIYHQEHEKRKEANLNKKMIERANFIRREKALYLRNKIEDGITINEGEWGTEEPHQEKFLKYWTDWENQMKLIEVSRFNALDEIKSFIQNKKLPVKSVEVKWRE